MESRIKAEATPQEAGILWVSAYTLMGLSYPAAFIEQMRQGVQSMDMEDSVTYQAIIAKGRVEGRVEGWAEGERDALLRIGRKRFGTPAPEVVAAIGAITSEGRLGQLIERAVEVKSWAELLAA